MPGRKPRDLTADILAFHISCAAALKDVFELGCALAAAMDETKATRVRYGRLEFQPDTGCFRDLLERMMDRGKTFWTGGGTLRVMLDDVANAYVPTTAYFGWKYSKKRVVRLSPGPTMTMGDIVRVREFADRLDAALDMVVPGVYPTLPVAVLTKNLGSYLGSYRIDSRRVEEVVRAYKHHIWMFRLQYEEAAVVEIQRAWRRARDTPGYAVWRRRMLAEFHEMQQEMKDMLDA